MTLSEFLLARIAEDEVVARKANREPRRCTGRGAILLIARFSSERILAECEAKRRIVTRVQRELDADIHNDRATHLMYDTLELLALPYADHPDYQEEWRP